MPLSFPSSPAVNQTTTQNGRVYRWSGLAWEFDSFTTAADDARWSLFLPPAPTNVTASAGNGQASVTWTAPSVLSVTPVTDYVVQYSSNSGSTWTTFSDGTSTSTSATVTGLTNGTAYVFRVAAVNGVGTGSYSDPSAVLTPTAPAITITSQPSNQTAANGSATFSVTATVTQSAALSYQWQKQEGGTGSFSNVSGATSSSLVLSNLTDSADNGDVYRVVVSATGGAESVTSSSATLTVTPAGDPLWSSVRLLVPFNNTTADVGPSSLTATGGNAPTYVAGKFGNAAYFYRDFNRYAVYSTSIGQNENFTLEGWFQQPSAVSGNVVTMGDVGAGISVQLVLNSQLQMTLYSGDGQDNSAQANNFFTLTAGQWHHIAVVRQGLLLRVYVDGVQQFVSGTGYNILTASPALTGLKVSDNQFNGTRIYVDDLRLTAAARYPDGTTFTPPTAAFPIA